MKPYFSDLTLSPVTARSVAAGIFAALLVLGAPARAQEGFELEPVIHADEFVLEIGAGEADYREDVSIAPVESQWDAATVNVGAGYVWSGRSPVLFRLDGSLWASEEAEETWRESGALVQRNQLEAGGVEVGTDLGVPIFRTDRGRLRAWAGIAYRNQQYDRSRFESTLQDGDGFGAVGEGYDIALVRAELEGRMELAPSIFVEAGGRVGYAVYSRADNDLLGTIDGSGGTVVEGRIDLGWQASDRHALSAGVRFGLQDLDGDSESRGSVELSDGNIIEQVVEWPDNQLDILLFAVRWTYSF